MATVTEVLTSATDSVNLINDVNDNGSSSAHVVLGMPQEEINDMVQRNVDHLEIILAYEPSDENDPTPDVVGDSSDKTPYTTAITTGKAYIQENS